MALFPEIPGYRIEKKLAEGRISDIYLGVQEDLDRQVAIKVMSPALFRDKRFAENFQKESKKLTKFVHPNFVNLIEVGEYNQLHFIVMEYLPLGLREKINRKFGVIPTGGDIDSLPLEEEHGLEGKPLLQLLADVGQALEYAHKADVIHRDIRPENIRFRDDGKAVVVGFFIAKVIGGSDVLEKMGMIAGTPHYVSPEQALRKPLDGCSDIYSLGVTLYEILTGTLPYNAEEAIAIENQHIMEPVPILPHHLSRYQWLLSRMMAKDKQDRVQSGNELINFLSDFSIKFPDKQPSKPPRPMRPPTIPAPNDNLISFSDKSTAPPDQWDNYEPQAREYTGKETQREVKHPEEKKFKKREIAEFDLGGPEPEPELPPVELIELQLDGPLPEPKKTKEKKPPKEKKVKEPKVVEQKVKKEKEKPTPKPKKERQKLNLHIDFSGILENFRNPRVLIPIAATIVLALLLWWIFSPSKATQSGDKKSTATTAAVQKSLPPEEQALLDKKYNLQMTMAQKYYKNGDFERALDKAKAAHQLKQTPETKQLLAELGKKITADKEENSYKTAMTSGTLPPLEDYLEQFPSGRYVNQVETQLNRLKEEARIKEEEQLKVLANALKLRATPKDLTLEDVKTMIIGRGFFEQYYNPKGKFNNKFHLQMVGKEPVVADYATGLMWHQAGSENYGDLSEAQQWLQQLNKTGYAGHSDWRMPTLDEAVSLLANSEGVGGLFLNKIFSRDQAYIWTTDTFEKTKIWAVDYNSGDVNRVESNFTAYIRPVRNLTTQ